MSAGEAGPTMCIDGPGKEMGHEGSSLPSGGSGRGGRYWRYVHLKCFNRLMTHHFRLRSIALLSLISVACVAEVNEETRPSGVGSGRVKLVHVLAVGPGKTLTRPSQAAQSAHDGDVIEIRAGVYSGDAAVWTRNDLTIRGVNGRAHLEADGDTSHNLQSNEPGFVDRVKYDYHLRAGSPAIDAGVDPGAANGFQLAPVAQYVHPAAEEPRPKVGKLDLGAYEYSGHSATRR
jgi:hypothetical protein